MASIAMLIGGALVNALAFSGSNFLFSKLGHSDEERVRHDKAVEQLQIAHEAWSKKRTEHLDWINEELRREGHAIHTFRDVDNAMNAYYAVTGNTLKPLDSEPELSDFYTPSAHQKDRELVWVVLGMAATGLVAYKISS